MDYTALPSEKGQVTIPFQLRKKYKISNQTPMVISDKGKGVLTIKIMQLTDPEEDIRYYENAKETGLVFKKGIDPDTFIKAGYKKT